MELVLVSGQYHKLIKNLEQFQHDQIQIEITKVKSPYVYFKVASDIGKSEVISSISRAIRSDKNTTGFDFQIYGFYKGKIDFLTYMSDQSKQQYDYYKNK